MKYEKNCLIVLKGGLIKSYNFSDDFYNKNKKIVNDFANIFDEIYKNSCCVYGATETNKNNEELKLKLCSILETLFNMNIEIMNGWDDKTYKNTNDIKDYILNYGKGE